MPEMNGRVAIEAHKLLAALDTAMKGRGEKPATADQFLVKLHELGYDIVSLPSVAGASVVHRGPVAAE